MKILVAEDDMPSRKFLLKFLSTYGHCDVVVDGMEALDAFAIAMKEKEPYDLICLDIMMPKVDGVKVLKAIRDFETQRGFLPKNRVKIVMITALMDKEYIRKTYELGCDEYIDKPIETTKLIEIMNKLNIRRV